MRLLVLAAVALLAPGAAFADAPREMRVAIMDFANATPSPDLDALGKGLQSMVTTDLSQVGTIHLVERARLRDLEGELKLAKSGLVDKQTAVRLGKLAGATHLLSGTFTVVGAQMRIDCRLFTVESGDVLWAEKMEGEKDAFFELEKSLVKKLVTAFGVKLAPKERAELARIHTSDFEAFRRYSQGVDFFDEQKYQEAVAALRDAQSRDQDFKLATYTLTQYQELIAKLKTKADDVQNAQLDMRFLEQQKGAKTEFQIIDKLYEIARKKGGDPVERLVALAAIIHLQGPGTQLYAVEDHFALQRAADAASRQYFAEVQPLFPRLPMRDVAGRIWSTYNARYKLDDLDSLDHFSEAFADAVKGARAHMAPPANSNVDSNRRAELWNEVDAFEDIAKRLQLDRRETAELGARLYQAAAKQAPPSDGDKLRALEKLGQAFRQVLDFDKSTTYFAAAAAGAKDPSLIRRMAEEVEQNRDASRLVARLEPRQFVRERLAIDSQNFHYRDLEELFPSSKLTPKAAASVAFWRDMRYHHYILFDDEPVWNTSVGLATGPRQDEWRASELRYYPRFETEFDALAVWGQKVRKDVAARFEVSFQPGPDFWPPGSSPGRDATMADAQIAPGRPEVGFFFGMRDIDSDLRAPKTGAWLRPTRAFVVRLLPDAVELARATEGKRQDDSGSDKKRLDFQTIGSEPVKLGSALGSAAKLAVSVSVKGRIVEVEVAGKRCRFTLPEDPAGYVGFQFRGRGYAAVSAIKLSK